MCRGPNRGAHQRSGRQAVSLTAESSGEVPCSGARRRDKAERSERRDSRRRSRREQVIMQICISSQLARSLDVFLCRQTQTLYLASLRILLQPADIVIKYYYKKYCRRTFAFLYIIQDERICSFWNTLRDKRDKKVQSKINLQPR